MTTENEVSFPSGALRLAGTLSLPATGKRSPAVLMVAGSGRIDRNENGGMVRLNVFRDIAAYLAAQGFATLRYDKRGIGASEGDFYDTGFHDEAADAFAALKYLRAHQAVDPQLVFLLGHSAGAIIAVRMAATGAEVAGLVLLAGTAQAGEDVLVWQCRQIANGIRGATGRLLELLHIDLAKLQRRQLEKLKHSTANTYRMYSVVRLNAKWMREFMAYNPAVDMPNIGVPVLALTGTKDIQVDPNDLKLMAGLIKTGFESHEVPDLTHTLRTDPGPPSMSTYKRQSLKPVDPQVLQYIADWLARHSTG